MDGVWVAIYVLAGLCAILLGRSVYLQYRVNSLEEAAHKTADVVKTLSEALSTINDGYKDHEKRIMKLEKVEDVSETEGRYIFHLDGTTRMVTKNALREILGMIPVEKPETKRICRDCAKFRLMVDRDLTDAGYGHCISEDTPFIVVAECYKDCPYFEKK